MPTDDFAVFLSKLRKALEAAPNPHFLLITCIDLRYPGMIHEHLEYGEKVDPKDQYGFFHKKYDQVSLAGAGLSGVVDFGDNQKPNWASTFLDQVGLSKTLHTISAVVVLEHRTCGAYKYFKLLGEAPTEDEERNAHEKQTQWLAAVLKRHYSDLLFFSHLLPKESEAKRLDRLAQALPFVGGETLYPSAAIT